MILLNPTNPVYENRLLSVDAKFAGNFEAVILDYADLLDLDGMTNAKRKEVFKRLFGNVVVPLEDFDA